jgi:Uma2 family endonuclease
MRREDVSINIREPRKVDYPTSDGKPMAETDYHFILMAALRQILDRYFASDPMIYVSGNLLMYYVSGNKRKHVAPDVFVVKGVEKKKRLYFLTWEEGKTPAVVIEVTSKSTRKEDTDTKFTLYRDTLKVKEYFLFDPFGDYLKPERLRGYRLRKGEYEPIALVDGRMPSKELSLDLEPDGGTLRLYDPETKAWLPTPDERAELAAQRADDEKQRADDEKQRADDEKQRADRAEQELARLRQEIEKQRRRNGA